MYRSCQSISIMKAKEAAETYEGSQVLKAIVVLVIGLGEGVPIFEDKGDFHDPSGASCHERVTKDTMHMGA